MTDKLQQAIDAIEVGNKEAGQQLLVQLIEAEPKDAQAWLWLAKTMDDDKRRQCYWRVLDIFPHNYEAREALGVLPKEQPWAKPKGIDAGSGVGSAIFVIAAILLGLVAWLEVSQATLGVAIIGAACLCGIVSRIAQAEHHQRNLLKMLKRLDRDNI